ncbi:hypothetical protein WOSG25_390030 [Weissella oryzae SG25]|uniref:Thoeris anti-defense 2-like domain-containing protein n=1 Tax=Weissella oryzae (strain DSM 25784 / JCM 18191 / LMG 30913 / SG25) TaxID=1329250 RepID=A0A069CXL4_WEIOS|nr:DUF2829 domain-containing protein [Weissella oryzae]GAK32107.1 hypothetical protein WOSG25_390030 [Weissella oryzae SG25]
MNKFKGLDFGQALEQLRAGKNVARRGWNGSGIYIGLHKPVNEFMTQEFIYINTTGLITDNDESPKSLVPWLASQTDMLANDWVVVAARSK